MEIEKWGLDHDNDGQVVPKVPTALVALVATAVRAIFSIGYFVLVLI